MELGLGFGLTKSAPLGAAPSGPFTPNDWTVDALANLNASVGAGTIEELDTPGKVSKWVDESDELTDYAQTTGSLQPDNGRTINGLNYIDFLGDILTRDTAAITIAGDFTYAMLLAVDVFSIGDSLHGDGGGFAGRISTTTTSILRMGSTNYNTTIPTLTAGVPFILMQRRIGTTLETYINGGTAGTVTTAVVNTRTRNMGDDSGGVGTFVGALNKFAVFDGAGSAADMNSQGQEWADEDGVITWVDIS